jgi:hypothetical protein
MQAVLALIEANVAGKVFASTERTVQILGQQKESFNQVLVSINTTSSRIETAILEVKKLCGPLADLALDDKVEEMMQKIFEKIYESVRCLPSDVKTIPEDIHDINSRLLAPAMTTRQDVWVCHFSSVPSPPWDAVETQYIRNLYKVLVDKAALCRVVTAHG